MGRAPRSETRPVPKHSMTMKMRTTSAPRPTKVVEPYGRSAPTRPGGAFAGGYGASEPSSFTGCIGIQPSPPLSPWHDCGPMMNRLPFIAPSIGRDSMFCAQKTPPPQYLRPVPVSATPMQKTVVPVTIGGNSFLRMPGGTNDRRISRRAPTRHVPMNLP